jgi:hypothetical protein|tara:strand:+ start:87 stop:488 length:402 start_codon:yes stop_codon:yes gene_type:complete
MNNLESHLPSNKIFGLFFSSIFGLAGLYFLFKDNSNVGYLFFTLSFIFIVTSILNSKLLLPMNKLWMHFGLLLGFIISPVVLGVIYFGIFTPISLLMRLFGRDELGLTIKSDQSFWKIRHESFNDPDTFRQQF